MVFEPFAHNQLVRPDGFRCAETCPSHDGKRCGILGYRAPDICVPYVKELITEVETLRKIVTRYETSGGGC